MNLKAINLALVLITFLLTGSCVKFKNLYEEKEIDNEIGGEIKESYIYPFKDESRNIVAEISIQADANIDLKTVEAEIPFLKYNKSWLFLITQDDCAHSAYCSTWASINGKPLSKDYFYDTDQLKAGDLPPDTYFLEKTLGSTDGAGNEVRFSFTTSLAPENDCMNEKTKVDVGFNANYYRFYRKTGLVWNNVIEMLNYGVGIAFHDVITENIDNPDSIKTHFEKSQEIILSNLSGRGCKTLAEPNGNKVYVTAAQNCQFIQTMAAQEGAEILYPFQVKDDLKKKLLDRDFLEQDQIKDEIYSQLLLKKESRKAIHIALHNTDSQWALFFLWLNDTYGKDGDDSVWVPNLEEYYEYNYYRTHGSVTKTVTNNVLKITVTLPSDQYFYYPTVTVNLRGLKKDNITSIITNNSITGFSHSNYEDGVMLNIDCRKFLVEHATRFVEKYKENKTESNKNDAIYFVNKLKDSDKKKELLLEIN